MKPRAITGDLSVWYKCTKNIFIQQIFEANIINAKQEQAGQKDQSNLE